MKVLDKTREGLNTAARLISSEEVILWPSCGIWVLACHAQSASALNRIYPVKSRDRGKPLPVIVNKKTADEYGFLDDLSRRLIETFWPGFLAVVVPKRETIPEYVTACGKTVALVCPNDLSERLSELVGGPIAATSANVSGEAEVLDPQEAKDRFRDDVAAIIEGPRLGGVLNTILDMTHTPPRIIRHGGVAREELHRLIPSL